MPATTVRPLDAADVASIGRLLSHPDLVGRRGLPHDRPTPRAASALGASLESIVDDPLESVWVIEAGVAVGVASVGTWWDAMTPWAHVVIHPDHQRRGHGTTAALHLLDVIFSTTPAAIVSAEVPSWDATGLSFAESLGGDRCGTNRRTGIRDGRYHDSVEFVILRDTWETNRATGR